MCLCFLKQSDTHTSERSAGVQMNSWCTRVRSGLLHTSHSSLKKKKKQKHISRMQLSTEHLLIHRTGSTSCSVAFCTLVLTVWFCACIQKCITWKVLSMRDKCFWRCFQTCYHCIVCNCFKTGSKWLWNGYVNHYVYSLFFGVVVAIL